MTTQNVLPQFPDSAAAVVIYHDNCADGFGSAWAFNILKEPEYLDGVSYIPCQYDKEPNGVYEKSKDVYILDFSFPRETLITLAGYVNKVILLDHHKTAKEALTDWPNKPENLHIVFDMNRSGAGITWDFFGYENNNPLAKIPRPRLINYIEDRDIWQFNLPWSKEINAVVAITEKEFREYTRINTALELSLMDMVHQGIALNTQFDKLCKEIAADAREVTIHGLNKEKIIGFASNCSPQFRSEVGNFLAVRSKTFGATYHSTKSGDVWWSLRSVGDFDVSEIAQWFGGGGHKNAARFVLRNLGESTEREIRLWASADSVSTQEG